MSQIIRRGDLLGYADDFAVICQSGHETSTMLKELAQLNEDSNILLNKKKCEAIVLGSGNIVDKAEIACVAIKEQVKYL